MQKFLRILSTVIVIMASCTSNFSAYANVGADCDDVQFIFARGSGENLSDASYLSWQTAIENAYNLVISDIVFMNSVALRKMVHNTLR